MQLKPCDCGAQHYGRIERAPWMRVWRNRRLFQCNKCLAVMLLNEEQSMPVLHPHNETRPADLPARQG